MSSNLGIRNGAGLAISRARSSDAHEFGEQPPAFRDGRFRPKSANRLAVDKPLPFIIRNSHRLPAPAFMHV